jgi:hypothetical protein
VLQINIYPAVGSRLGVAGKQKILMPNSQVQWRSRNLRHCSKHIALDMDVRNMSTFELRH